MRADDAGLCSVTKMSSLSPRLSSRRGGWISRLLRILRISILSTWLSDSGEGELTFESLGPHCIVSVKVMILTYIRHCRECPGKHLAYELLFVTISNVLAVFDIVKARDESGNEIPVREEYTSGSIRCVVRLIRLARITAYAILPESQCSCTFQVRFQAPVSSCSAALAGQSGSE